MRLPLAALVLALFACKQSKPEPARPPGLTPAGVYAQAAREGASFPTAPVRVTGTVVQSEAHERPAWVMFDAGNEHKLKASMHVYQCARGVCSEDPPMVGWSVTLKCTKGMTHSKADPELIDCSRE